MCPDLNVKLKLRAFVLAVFLFSLLIAGQSNAQQISQDTLPDNHLLFTLEIQDDKLVGANEHLKGITLSMEFPAGYLEDGLDLEGLMELVRDQDITGHLTYSNGAASKISYEVVRHRGSEEIYMKTTMGYFLWETVTLHEDKLYFVIDWWYRPPARDVDLNTLVMARRLLADAKSWNKNDDRKCDDDIDNNQWSLFCALKHASIENMGEYNHHNAAMQTVRFVIEDLDPDQQFEHALMDYNNAPSTRHQDILRILMIAQESVKKELREYER
jgi:hypothetical protein